MRPAQGALRRCVPVVCLLICWLTTCSAIKLRFRDSECVEENIIEPNSLVTASLVSLSSETRPAYFDVEVRDPNQVLIFTKERVDRSEMAFKTRYVGRHSFCLTVHPDSHGITTNWRPTREVLFDINVGETWSHDRVKQAHMDSLWEGVSSLKQKLQLLQGELKFLRNREIRHRQTVDSMTKRVQHYALVKGAVITLVAVMQVAAIRFFFRKEP